MTENEYLPDFEISKRYIDFSSELLRLSLLAITGIGYLLFEHSNCKKLTDVPQTIFIISQCLFIVTSSLALVHRYYATDALSYLIAFLKTGNLKEKEGFIKCLKKSGLYLILCQYAFALAIIITVCGIIVAVKF